MAEVVIAGGGLAAASTAESLREQGFDGSIEIITTENHLPYDRPPLSKEFLAGDMAAEDLTLHDQAWYDERSITVRQGVSVTGVDASSRSVTLSDGESVDYSTLVLATGSEPRRLDLEGASLSGVLTLRSYEDSVALKEKLGSADGTDLVVVGGGWIGLEVGAHFRTAGATVTVLEAGEQPLKGALGATMGEWFANFHRKHGVDVRTGAKVDGFTGAGGSVTGVRLAGGETVPADLVLVGVGATPRVELAEDAGVEVDNGVIVDEHGRTSDEHIYATGDIANYPDPVLGRLRVEHWAQALNHPKAVAAAIAGQSEPYDKAPFFYSDQFDLGMEYAGHGAAEDELVVRGSLDDAEYIAFWVRDGHVTAGMNVNVWDVTDEIQRLIRDRVAVDERLADPKVALTDLR